MATQKSDSIQDQIKRIGREFGVLANKATAEAYKIGAWRLFNAGEAKVMLISVIGRKSGKTFTTPIGYVRDSEYIYVATRRDSGRISNWFRNLKANSKVWLQIADKRYQGRGETFEDDAQIIEILRIWARVNPSYFRFFGVKLNGRKNLTEAEIVATAQKVVTGRIKLI